MPSFQFDVPILWYLGWSAAGFLGAAAVNSFVEWLAHRYILHSPKIVRFAYELHDRQHHVLFKADESYIAVKDTPEDAERREHVTFVRRDYIVLLMLTMPIWLTVELLTGVPVTVGGVLATLAGLQAFNSWHLMMHVPTGRWFEKTRVFKFLERHHRLHHADTRVNYNVVFPLADLLLGTLRR